MVVVGGGPGGMETARIAALRGHEVILFEQSDRLGGRLWIGALTPHKQEVGVFVDSLERQVRKLGVEVRTGRQATVAEVSALALDAVVVATGGEPVVPERPGVERLHMVIAEDILVGTPKVGQR